VKRKRGGRSSWREREKEAGTGRLVFDCLNHRSLMPIRGGNGGGGETQFKGGKRGKRDEERGNSASLANCSFTLPSGMFVLPDGRAIGGGKKKGDERGKRKEKGRKKYCSRIHFQPVLEAGLKLKNATKGRRKEGPLEEEGGEGRR